MDLINFLNECTMEIIALMIVIVTSIIYLMSIFWMPSEIILTNTAFAVSSILIYYFGKNIVK